MYDAEVKALEQRYKDLDYRVSDKLADPKKLMDIVNVGLEDPMLATCAIAEILE